MGADIFALRPERGPEADASDINDVTRFRRHDTKVDLSGEYRVNRYASVFFAGRNIFNHGQTWMQAPAGAVQGQSAVVRGYEIYGANWNFCVKGTF